MWRHLRPLAVNAFVVGVMLSGGCGSDTPDVAEPPAPELTPAQETSMAQAQFVASSTSDVGASGLAAASCRDDACVLSALDATALRARTDVRILRDPLTTTTVPCLRSIGRRYLAAMDTYVRAGAATDADTGSKLLQAAGVRTIGLTQAATRCALRISRTEV